MGGTERTKRKGIYIIFQTGYTPESHAFEISSLFFSLKCLNASCIGKVWRVNAEISSTLISLLGLSWLRRVDRETNGMEHAQKPTRNVMF